MTTARKRWIEGILGVTGLLAVYLFQRQIQACFEISGWSNYATFASGKITRFLLNDLFVILMIHALFPPRKYLYLALFVQLCGTLFILIPYLIIKHSFPAYNGPLISFLHRLVLNPLLLLLLIPAFFYQQQQAGGRFRE